MSTTEQQIRAHIREAIKEVTESHTFTNKHDDDPSLKGGQKKKLPDELQSAMINADTNENTTPAENEQKENKMKTTEQQIREHIRAAIKEIRNKNPAQHDNTLSEPKHLSEARQHVRNVINEVMVGMTPITRMNTQGNAKKARKGNNTNTAVDKAELGFNTFDMQEWASIAGIDEKHLSEAISDDTGNSSMLGGSDAPFDNVVDIGADEYDTSDEIPGMVVGDNRSDSAPYEADGMISDMMSDIEKRHLQFKANKRGSDVDDMEDEVEDHAYEYIANRAEPDVFDIRDFLAEIRKR